MSETGSDIEQLREQYAGSYVAWLGDEVYLSAETYDDLRDRLDQMPIDQGELVVGYIEPSDAIRFPWTVRVGQVAAKLSDGRVG